MDNTTRYPVEQMDKAFKLVQNKEHWKNPINAVIAAKDRDVVDEAIIYYTGSVGAFTPMKGGKLRVRADGYYIAIGA
jgi:hypothetical protein